VDLTSDVEHCGACDSPCYGGEVCNGQGQCSATCQPGYVLCDHACVDPLADADHCGAAGDCQGANAGVVCEPNEGCTGGSCVALPCEDLWESGPNANDVEAAATELSAQPIDDCADQASTNGVIHGGDDVDWYHYVGEDGNCIANPYQLLEQTSATARLCVFFECVDPNASTQFPCPEGTTEATSPEGRAGCCAAGSGADFTVTGLNCTGSIDESVHVLVRVDDPAGDAETCTAYLLRYNF
jgi:hypothetical protein